MSVDTNSLIEDFARGLDKREDYAERFREKNRDVKPPRQLTTKRAAKLAEQRNSTLNQRVDALTEAMNNFVAFRHALAGEDFSSHVQRLLTRVEELERRVAELESK